MHGVCCLGYPWTGTIQILIFFNIIGNGKAGLQKASTECQGDHENRRESVH